MRTTPALAPLPSQRCSLFLSSHLPLSTCVPSPRVNVYKDKVKNAGSLPPLPQQQALHEALAGTYAELR